MDARKIAERSNLQKYVCSITLLETSPRKSKFRNNSKRFSMHIVR